ncbi:Protein of unknown function [Gryllus bimaculatus]|nr:Protein of unknown function [Gryllus bimaculatus]
MFWVSPGKKSINGHRLLDNPPSHLASPLPQLHHHLLISNGQSPPAEKGIVAHCCLSYCHALGYGRFAPDH